jgi:hypothetical protein
MLQESTIQGNVLDYKGGKRKVQDIAIARAEHKDSYGNNIKTQNFFSVLVDDDIVSRV